MPTTNISWVKLYLSLLDADDRFLYQLNERQQLLYIKLLMLSGRTHNQIPKNTDFIRNKIQYLQEKECFLKDISKIMEVFPKFKSNKSYFYFENFSEIHNQIQNDKWGIKKKESYLSAEGLIHSGLSHNGLSKIREDKNRIDNTTDLGSLIGLYVSLKQQKNMTDNNPAVFSSIYKRECKSAKELLGMCSLNEAKEAMQWISDQPWSKDFDWHISTVVKKYPQYLQNKNKVEVRYE